MPTEKHILQVLSARDRVIDLLGIGETYPLQDVMVEEAKLTVDFDNPSTFYIDPGQKDVRYDLFEGIFQDVEEVEDIDPVGSCVGTGEKTTLSGPDITVDRVFQIRASKIDRAKRKAFLFDTASVKVGLDTSLRAWIPISQPGIELLHPGPNNPPNTAPRIANYGGEVEVKVGASQAGADYRLVDHNGEEISQQSVKGDGNDISLFTKQVKEDTTIRIGVQRTFLPSEGRENLTEKMLLAELPLAVRANPAVGVSIDGGPIADPENKVQVRIAGSQQSVAYGAYVRTLLDEDFNFDSDSTRELLTISVPASLDVPQHSVGVYKPPQPTPLQPEDGYTRRAFKLGTGGDLTLSIEPPVPDTIQDRIQDRIIVITAQKDHRARMLGQPGTSELQLEQVVVALTRPEQPGLTLLLDDTAGTLLVVGGQRGVFYHFRVNGEEIGLPAYFHRLDELDQNDPPANRGLGQLRIETDFVITREAPDAITEDLAHLRPLHPLIDVTVGQPAPTALDVTAVKARTGVSWLASVTVQTSTELEEP